MLTYIKAVKVTKLCMDKLYVASSYTKDQDFVMLQELERSMIQSNRQQQSSYRYYEDVLNNSLLYNMLNIP